MKVNNIIIALLIGVCVFLLFQKRPLHEPIKYINRYETRIDTLLKDTTIFKTKIRRFKDTIYVFKDSITIAKENKDTIKIIAFQDALIKQQDYNIKWQDTLITQIDSIMMYQNKVNEKLYDSVNVLNNDKRRLKKVGILAGIGLLTLLIIK
jgi:hypothetical protein